MENSTLPSITSATWQSMVTESKGYVLVDFWFHGSGPCVMLMRSLEELNPAYIDKCKFFAVDTGDDPELMFQLRIQGIPSLVLFKDGKEIARYFGVKAKSDLKAWLDERLAG